MTREWARILHLTSRRHAFATSNRRPLAGLSDKALTSHGIGRKWKLVQKLGPEFRINLTHPDHSLLLQAPLAADAGGAGLCKNPDGSAVFKDKADAETSTGPRFTTAGGRWSARRFRLRRTRFLLMLTWATNIPSFCSRSRSTLWRTL